MPVYPEAIASALENMQHSGDLTNANAQGRAVNFECGGFVEICMEISDEIGAVTEARFRTNGCGYMAAAADFLCGELAGASLADLHGLEDLGERLNSGLNVPPRPRTDCFSAVVEAVRSVFKEHRDRCVEEFAGEKVLICTCFGVSEETIQRFIEREDAGSVEEVSVSLRAGSGCGSCRMLIQELIDSAGS